MLELLECGLCFLAGGVIIGVWVDLWHSKRYANLEDQLKWYSDLEKQYPKEFQDMMEKEWIGWGKRGSNVK
jgi:hypothetical protein